MKLLYITNGINGSGGLERVLSVKASYLAEHYDYEVSVLVLNNAHRNPFYEFSDTIKFYSINVGGNPLAYWKSYKKGIQNVVNEINPDIISVCDDGLKGFFIPGFLKTKAKIIYERHVSKLIEVKSSDGLLKSLATKLKWRIMEHQAKKFAKFVVLTNGNKKEWLSLKNMEVISNPLSFYPEESSTLQNKTAICVGKISYQKGQDLLVQAWKEIHRKHPEWKLKMYGKPNDNFLKTKEWEKYNIFAYPPEKNIKKKFIESSICVMSSRFEGFGMVLIEALACGVPCISFNCDYGPADIIDDGIDGFLIEKESINDLSKKIIELIIDEDKRFYMGSNAKKNVMKFKPDVIIKLWDELFESVRK